MERKSGFWPSSPFHPGLATAGCRKDPGEAWLAGAFNGLWLHPLMAVNTQDQPSSRSLSALCWVLVPEPYVTKPASEGLLSQPVLVEAKKTSGLPVGAATEPIRSPGQTGE